MNKQELINIIAKNFNAAVADRSDYDVVVEVSDVFYDDELNETVIDDYSYFVISEKDAKSITDNFFAHVKDQEETDIIYGGSEYDVITVRILD